MPRLCHLPRGQHGKEGNLKIRQGLKGISNRNNSGRRTISVRRSGSHGGRGKMNWGVGVNALVSGVLVSRNREFLGPRMAFSNNTRASLTLGFHKNLIISILREWRVGLYYWIQV